MSTKAGQLLWNRMRVVFPPNINTVDVDTGLTQVNRGLEDPPLGGDAFTASRVQVIPLSPINDWAQMTHDEPYFDPNTGTVHVFFTAGGIIPEPPFQIDPINVLFWDPHTLVGPGDADTYNPTE